MKLYTSYFANISTLRRDGLFIFSIANQFPPWLQGQPIMTLHELIPRAEMLKMGREDYRPLYMDILGCVQADQLFRKITMLSKGKDAVVCCYESWKDCESGKKFCHRHIFAEWFEAKTGIKVVEYPLKEKQPEKVEHKNIQPSLFD